MPSDPRFPAWRRYLRFLRPDTDADIDDELDFHLAERIEALRAEGVDDQAARAPSPSSATCEPCARRSR